MEGMGWRKKCQSWAGLALGRHALGAGDATRKKGRQRPRLSSGLQTKMGFTETSKIARLHSDALGREQGQLTVLGALPGAVESATSLAERGGKRQKLFQTWDLQGKQRRDGEEGRPDQGSLDFAVHTIPLATFFEGRCPFRRSEVGQEIPCSPHPCRWWCCRSAGRSLSSKDGCVVPGRDPLLHLPSCQRAEPSTGHAASHPSQKPQLDC